MRKKSRTFIGKLKEEFLMTTETLWNNEVQANLFVARILIYTAILAILIIVLSAVHVFSIDAHSIARYLGIAVVELLVPAGLCIYLKGEKPWLKVILMVAYVIVLARLHMVLGHNIVLCLVFPVALSVRYYSRPLTDFVAGLTVITYLLASYYGITHAITRVDLNMLELPGGTVLEFPEYTGLRNVIDPNSIDYNRLFLHFLQHSFLPKFILFFMIATICAMIAKRGRMAIYAQKEETEKTERLATELNLASDIQTNVLPNIFPVFPERKEFHLYASMTAAKEVGGDFYDFFFVDDDHIALVMADVSGKGIPAALFMMVARTLIKNRAMLGGTPSEILYDVNNQLCEGNVAELFVTVWLGILEISTGKGVSANAGHEHPVISKNGEEFSLVIYRHSPVVAAMEGMQFKQHEFNLEPGDTIFVYTDGVAEATNSANELFGTDRMLDALNKEPDAMPEKVLENVMDGINEFVQGAEQFDDITMLCLKYFGPNAE
jgi:serine phosphatase RsbU (regulator of sigma subunit)